MPSCVPLCSKYAHIKLCLDCSSRVPNASVNVLLEYFNFQYSVTVLLEYIDLYLTFFSQHSCKSDFYHVCTLSHSASCKIGRVSASLITNAQKFCLRLCWHYADAFGYLLCPKLCWHNRRRPTDNTYIYYMSIIPYRQLFNLQLISLLGDLKCS